jgi:glycosyltransferase involved in cell wall biosynthesis
MPKLVLILMVKNEEKILRRCLEAVEGVVDAFVITDTGSTDKTVEIAQEFLEVHKGCLGHAPWKDFGLESTSFFHQDTVRWPGTAYGVRLVRAMDPGEPGEVGILLLDIDISLEESVELGDADRRIAEMRFLKNRVFFSTVRNPKHRFGARR